MTATYYTVLDSPLGRLLIASDGSALTHVHIVTERGAVLPAASWVENPRAAPLSEARWQLDAYFRGDLRHFEIPQRPAGTEFQKKVWRELARIPYGQTISYGDLACRIGNPNASRAVGMANGRNPLMIVVPCHRVIGASGDLTGFSAGLTAKRTLLDLERCAGSVHAL